MAVELIKSAPVTNLDTIPPTPNTTGEGAQGYLRHIDGVAPVSAGSSATSTYRMVRLPSNAKVKSIDVLVDAAPGAGAVTVGAAYSDATNDGTPIANQGVLISASVFSAALTLGAANARVDGLTALPVSKRAQPLWQAVGLASDPGGAIDVLLTVSTAVTNALNVAVEVRFVD